MRKLTTALILTISISTACNCSAYSDSNSSDNSNSFQNQAPYGQSPYNQANPNANDENSFMMQSDTRMNQLRQSNQSMINQDRNMMREGYDPNEYYRGVDPSDVPRPNHSYPDQEQMMRGQYQGNQAGQPQSYSLNNNYHSRPGSFKPQQSTPPAMGRNDRDYNRPKPNNYPNYKNSNVGYSAYQQSPSNETNRNNSSYQSGTQSFNSNKAASNYPSYRNPSYRNQSTQYISDNSMDMPPSSSNLNHSTTTVDTNPNWDTTDDLNMRQSSTNTIQSPEGIKAGQ